MPLTDADVAALKDLVSDEELISPSSSAFASHSVPWSLSFDKHPQLVICPSTEEKLQAVVKWLYGSSLDFAVRGKGLGSSSAEDVIISMKAFNKLVFDQDKELVEVGAGLDWGQIDTQLAVAAPGYLVVGARCPYVGVAGATLMGGFSWLSHELGIGSDPSNLIDVRIVLADGRAIWASSEPDLLWALRGGGGNFGIATALRLKAHKYAPSIYAGIVKIPYSQLETLSERVSTWTRTVSDPKVAMHLFVQPKEIYGLSDSKEPSLEVLPFDAHGEEHARSDAGFKWLFDIEGAVSGGGEMPLAGVHELQRDIENLHGTADSWLAAALVGDIDPNFVIRARDWWVDVVTNNPDLEYGTFVLLEIMQEAAFTSSGSPQATAWPHGMKGRQHVLQLSTGGQSSKNPHALADLERRSLDVMAKAPDAITGKPHPPGDWLPNFLLKFHDFAAVFGDNWSKLRTVKKHYDAKHRFNKTIPIPPSD